MASQHRWGSQEAAKIRCHDSGVRAGSITRYNPPKNTSLNAMRRLFLIVLLLPLAAQVHADWELVTKNSRGDRYYLASEIVQTGAVSLVWSLVDLVSPIEKSQSVKRLYEADCVKGKLRVLQKILYAGKGGQGTILTSDKTPGAWAYPDPASVNEEMILKICFDKKNAPAEAVKENHTSAGQTSKH